jgi:hypothetical protein
MTRIIHPLTDIYVPAEKFLACKREHLLDPSNRSTEHNIADGAVSVRYYSKPKIHEARIGNMITQRKLMSFWRELLSPQTISRRKVFEIMREGGRLDAFHSRAEVEQARRQQRSNNRPLGKGNFIKIDNSLYVRGLSSRDKFMYILKLKPYAKKEFNLVWSTHPRNGCEIIDHYITNVSR